jgi:pimeloyl-ACP methyl ester carboxylesterase
LRQALGYSQWNLYGVSYGTRTALYTMHLFPKGIRSVVLDSVLPPQVDRIGGDLTTTAASFSALFAACKADPACNRDYPDLETKFNELIQHLNSEPMKITVFNPETGEKKQLWITSASLMGGLEEIMKRGYLLRLAPLAITRIHDGDQNLLENLYAGLASAGNLANYNTVICHDSGTLFDADAFHAQVEKHPELKPLYVTYNDSFICPIWKAGQANPAETAAVQSDISTLILNGGEFDSSSPPSYAELAANTLSHGYLFIFNTR